jgi:hypothetical protein
MQHTLELNQIAMATNAPKVLLDVNQTNRVQRKMIFPSIDSADLVVSELNHLSMKPSRLKPTDTICH